MSRKIDEQVELLAKGQKRMLAEHRIRKKVLAGDLALQVAIKKTIACLRVDLAETKKLIKRLEGEQEARRRRKHGRCGAKGRSQVWRNRKRGGTLRQAPQTLEEPASRNVQVVMASEKDIDRCVQEIRWLMTDPFNNRQTHPHYFGMGLLDWTVEELLIRQEMSPQKNVVKGEQC